jgi:hypothetical protein
MRGGICTRQWPESELLKNLQSRVKWSMPTDLESDQESMQRALGSYASAASGKEKLEAANAVLMCGGSLRQSIARAALRHGGNRKLSALCQEIEGFSRDSRFESLGDIPGDFPMWWNGFCERLPKKLEEARF